MLEPLGRRWFSKVQIHFELNSFLRSLILRRPRRRRYRRRRHRFLSILLVGRANGRQVDDAATPSKVVVVVVGDQISLR